MIELKGVYKTYRRGAEDVHALKGIDLTVSKGEFISIVGPSGSGKTTLLHLMGCLDKPTKGIIKIDGLEIEGLQESALVEIRRKKIGFVFQQFYLIPGLSVFDNVTLPLLFSRKKVDRAKIISLLELVGLDRKSDRLPNQLSGGEMQRVAIARALVNDPEIILADEPSGNLDSENSEKIFSVLKSLNDRGFTVVLITHNPELAKRADRVVRLKDGLIQVDTL
ncbi:MAG: ABC transporter ATP-binding protein [Thermodesulfovibrionales bacterium]|nr:ABC transporter ATP-binding protein [Thermodesulfovibrionales bacterium]